MTPDHLTPEATLTRLRQMLFDIQPDGWIVGIRVTCRPENGTGRITFEVGEKDRQDSNADP